MSAIKGIYSKTPNFPPEDQSPLCLRFQFIHPIIGTIFVDAEGGAPSQAEIDAILFPSQDERASSAIDATDRVIFEVLFNQENRLRTLEGQPTITKLQFKNALITLWKQFNS